MSFIKRIIVFFKRKFKNKNSKKLLVSSEKNNNKEDFRKSLTVKTKYKKEKINKVSTLTCTGDGLGIENNICY